MITRSELAGNPVKTFGKTCGALSGLVIGGSLGNAARRPENRANHGITIGFNKDASQGIDDAEFVLLAVRTLIGYGGNLTSDIVVKAQLESVAVQGEFKRGGTSEIEAANNLHKGICPPLSEKHNTSHTSDGSAMRIGPVGIAYADDPERAAAMAGIDAPVSHYRDGIWGAQTMTVVISMAIVDAIMEEIFDTIMKAIPEESWFHHAVNRAFEIVDNVDGSILDAWMPLRDGFYTSSWTTTAEALPSAFTCLHIRSETFREDVVLAASPTRDMDTIGAAIGVILDAEYGASPIPAHWVEKTRYPTGACLQSTSGLDVKEMTGELAKLID